MTSELVEVASDLTSTQTSLIFNVGSVFVFSHLEKIFDNCYVIKH